MLLKCGPAAPTIAAMTVGHLNGSAPSDLAQYRVQRHFADHRAVAPDAAIEYAPASPAERKAFDRLIASGVIRETHPAHYWFDLDRMGRRARRAGNPKRNIAIALGVLVAVLTYWLYRS